jgi:hypothetical protein
MDSNSGWIVADLLDKGIEGVRAFCPSCGHIWQSPITFLPPLTTMQKVAELMACPICDRRDIEIGPDRDAAPTN